jgi:F-type H+-transporting ATPase subunit b
MMEQFANPSFWVALAFVLVVAVAFRPVMRTLTASLDARADKIRGQIEEARKLREDAQALLAEYQRKQREAMAEAEKIIAQARTDAAKMKVDAEKDLEHSLERRKQQALDRIAQSEAQALSDVRNTAVDVALAAAEKLIAGGLDPAKKAALADAAIRELQGRLN